MPKAIPTDGASLAIIGMSLRRLFCSARRETSDELQKRRHHALQDKTTTKFPPVANQVAGQVGTRTGQAGTESNERLGSDGQRQKRQPEIEDRQEKDLLSRLDYQDKDKKLVVPDPAVVFTYAEEHLKNGMIAR